MTADEAVEKILALRKLTEDCGVITRRTQSELLAALPAETLAEVAVRLSKHSKGNHDRYDRNS
jgi:hypothetical protein